MLLAACVPGSWSETRHMILKPETLERVQDQHDAHFIVAAKKPEHIPLELDYEKLIQN